MEKHFISYASDDAVYVEQELIPLLTALDAEVFYAPRRIQGGSYFEEQIEKALKSSSTLILVMSPKSARSPWVKAELNWALDNMNERIIPIMIEECKITDFGLRLPRVQVLHYYTDPKASAYKLISVLTALTPGRINAVNGQWKGTVYQEKYYNGQPINYPVYFDLEVTTYKQFGGSVIIRLPKIGDIKMMVTGGFLHDRFVQFFYDSADKETVQFGSAVLELLSDGRSKTMVGRWIGYGAKSQAIVNGEIRVKKIKKRD